MNVYIKGCFIVIACAGILAGFIAFLLLIASIVVHSYRNMLGAFDTVKCLSTGVEDVSFASTVASLFGIVA